MLEKLDDDRIDTKLSKRVALLINKCFLHVAPSGVLYSKHNEAGLHLSAK